MVTCNCLWFQFILFELYHSNFCHILPLTTHLPSQISFLSQQVKYPIRGLACKTQYRRVLITKCYKSQGDRPKISNPSIRNACAHKMVRSVSYGLIIMLLVYNLKHATINPNSAWTHQLPKHRSSRTRFDYILRFYHVLDNSCVNYANSQLFQKITTTLNISPFRSSILLPIAFFSILNSKTIHFHD